MCEEIKALNKMIDLAIQGKYEEKDFDESMRSLLESKLSKFIVQSQCHVRNTELEEKRVKTLISDISHQTKIPISNIVLYSELLLEMNLPTESTQYVNTITKQSKKLDFLISSLVKISRLESGIIKAKPQKGNIQTLLNKVIGELETEAKEKSISIHCQDLCNHACFDIRWTSEAIYNILENAIKYSYEGSVIYIRSMSYDFFL